MDTDQSGGISFEEFVAMMQLGEVETDFEKEIKEAFKFFDKDGDGEVGPLPFRSMGVVAVGGVGEVGR